MKTNYEAIGQLADKADNLIAAASLPLPPEMHVECLTNGLREISEEIKRLVVEGTGENPWE